MSNDEIYDYLRHGPKKCKKPKIFGYSSDSIRTEQRDSNCVVIDRRSSKVGVFFLNFEDEALAHRDALLNVIKDFGRYEWEAGYYFLRIEFCIDFCLYKDLNGDGVIDTSLIRSRLLAAHKKEFIRRLKLKNITDPNCLCFTVRTCGAKSFIWSAPDGQKYRICGRDF